MEHTKGDWEARTAPDYTQNYVNSNVGGEMGTIIALDIPHVPDANLIAAAPAMYEALKGLLWITDVVEPTHKLREYRTTARQALSRAEGK